MSTTTDLIQNLIGILGQPVVDRLMNDLRDIADEKDEAWKATILRVIADMTAEHGIAGVQLGIDLIKDVMGGAEDPDLSGLSLRAQSDLLAQLQRAEADRKKKASAFMSRIGESLGNVISGLLSGLA